ncbi:unnamed protein product, partial [Didymodactylos carnosus]
WPSILGGGLFNNEEILIFTRQLTQLLNKLNYSKLLHEQWIYYYNLGMTEDIWTGQVSPKMAVVHAMYYTYGRRKTLMATSQVFSRTN